MATTTPGRPDDRGEPQDSHAGEAAEAGGRSAFVGG